MTPSGWRQEKLPLCQKSISWNDRLIHHVLRTDCQTHYLLSFPQFKVPKSNYFISLFTINFPRKGKGNTYVKSQYGASRSQYLVLNTDNVLCLYYNTDGQLNNNRQTDRQTDRQTGTWLAGGEVFVEDIPSIRTDLSEAGYGLRGDVVDSVQNIRRVNPIVIWKPTLKLAQNLSANYTLKYTNV